MFDITKDSKEGLLITANQKITGSVGNFGRLLRPRWESPKSLITKDIEVDPPTLLMLAISHPPYTSFSTPLSAVYCAPSYCYSCGEIFEKANLLSEVPCSTGNVYFF